MYSATIYSHNNHQRSSAAVSGLRQPGQPIREGLHINTIQTAKLITALQQQPESSQPGHHLGQQHISTQQPAQRNFTTGHYCDCTQGAKHPGPDGVLEGGEGLSELMEGRLLWGHGDCKTFLPAGLLLIFVQYGHILLVAGILFDF